MTRQRPAVLVAHAVDEKQLDLALAAIQACATGQRTTSSSVEAQSPHAGSRRRRAPSALRRVDRALNVLET